MESTRRDESIGCLGELQKAIAEEIHGHFEKFVVDGPREEERSFPAKLSVSFAAKLCKPSTTMEIDAGRKKSWRRRRWDEDARRWEEKRIALRLF